MSNQRNADKDREIIALASYLQAHPNIAKLVERAVSAEQRVAELEQKVADAIDQIQYMRDMIPNELWTYKEHEDWVEQASDVIKSLNGEKSDD